MLSYIYIYINNQFKLICGIYIHIYISIFIFCLFLGIFRIVVYIYIYWIKKWLTTKSEYRKTR